MIKHRRLTLYLLALVGSILLYLACGGPPKLSQLPPDELFELGKARYDDGKYLKAIEIFQNLVYSYPGEAIVDTAQYYLALSYFGNKDYQLAQVEFNRLILNYPSSAYAVHSQFMRAVCFFEGTPKHYGLDQTDLVTAIQQFEDFLVDHPESELVPDCRKYLLTARTRLARKYYQSGVVYVRINALSAAKTYFQKVVDDFTDTEYAARAGFQVAEVEYKLKNYGEARRRFVNFLTVFPNHEWSEKASRRVEESTFKNAEMAFEKGDFILARDQFELFKREYPESKRLKKLNKYLKQIEGMSLDESGAEQASSSGNR